MIHLLDNYTFSPALRYDAHRLIYTYSEKEEPIRIELVGLCTDICVISNALIIKAFFPEITVSVDSGCCAGVTPEKHEAALETMRSCQVEVY